MRVLSGNFHSTPTDEQWEAAGCAKRVQPAESGESPRARGRRKHGTSPVWTFGDDPPVTLGTLALFVAITIAAYAFAKA